MPQSAVVGEREFWDRWVGGSSLASLRREAAFVAAEPLWSWAVGEVAAVRPKLVLDLGCGRGFTTPLLGSHDTRAVGVDLSLRSLSAARSWTRDVVPAPSFVAARLESLPFPARSFDAVAGRFVLHHAESLDLASGEIARVLRPGGVAVFVETWGRNPILRCGRDIAELLEIGFGTPDETPLGEAALTTLARDFDVEVAFPVFTGFELVNRVFTRLRPLVRRSARVRAMVARLWHTAARLDRRVERDLPWLKPWGWHAGLVLRARSGD